MKHPPDTRRRRRGFSDERGSSRLSFYLVVLVIAAAGYAAYQVVPVLYRASVFKVYMKDTVDKGAATGKDAEWVRGQLNTVGVQEYGLPPGALVETNLSDGRINARVRYTRPIDLTAYVYQYDFDHAVKSDKFLGTQ
jgi:hypothetical protein